MFYELIMLCSSINRVITAKLQVVLTEGSDDCSQDALGKYDHGNGLICKVAGGNQDVTVTKIFPYTGIVYSSVVWCELAFHTRRSLIAKGGTLLNVFA